VLRWRFETNSNRWLLRGKQDKALTLAQVPWRYDQKVSPIEGRDLAQIKALGERDYARVHHLKAQRRVGRKQLSHSPVVVRGCLDDPQLVSPDSCQSLSDLFRAA
jgi:hypothetical protein